MIEELTNKGVSFIKIYNQHLQIDKRKRLRQNQTNSEKILWSYLRDRRLEGYKFYRQYGVGRFILDFYCPKARLAIELDGGLHLKDDQRKYDQDRAEWLDSMNIKVIRFFNSEIETDVKSVCIKILKLLNELSTN